MWHRVAGFGDAARQGWVDDIGGIIGMDMANTHRTKSRLRAGLPGSRLEHVKFA
jgi:hypothetical protein